MRLIFFRLAKKVVNEITQLYFKIVKSKVECNVCHYKANQLASDSWHLYCTCPNCYSGVRQRLLMASFSLLGDYNIDKIISGKSVLHFAPEKVFGELLKQRSGIYKTADYFTEGYFYSNIDYNIDISNMSAIENETFDCVIACDVLEHVPDHISALKEVYRILRVGGYCIFTVPQKDNLLITYEDLSITDKNEREKIFGQFDHLRIYGEDFSSILQNSGFKVTAIDEKYFKKETVERFVLFPPVLSKHPLATNYRKVFFGKKQAITKEAS